MSARKPTQRERHRAVLSRRAEARLARILAEPRPQLFVPDIGDSDAFHAELHALLAEAILRAGAAECVYAVHFTHDLEEFCAVVGEPLGSGFSNRPVLAIFSGDPFRIWTVDRNPVVGGEILAGGPSRVIPFAGGS